MKLIVQIPCYNEAATLPRTLAGIARSYPGIGRVETLVIDDGSTDGTSQVARQCHVDHLIRHTQNRGLAAAFATGLDASLRLGADVIVNTDADGQYPGEAIGQLIAPIVAGEADMVIGDRHPWSNPHFSRTKRVLQWLGSRVVSGLAGRRVPDAVSGFRALSREAALRLNTLTSFSYTVETVLQASEKGLAVAYVPVPTHRTTRPSRLFRSLPEFVVRSATTMLRVYAMFHPLRVFGGLSLVLMLAGIVPIARFLILYAMGQGAGHVQSLVLGGVLFLAGCLMMGLGIVADLISFNRRLLETTLEKVRRLEAELGILPSALWSYEAAAQDEEPASRKAPDAEAARNRLGVPPSRCPVGVTLLELLVVIAIVGVLVALLLPAVQSARESARRLQCASHLKQIATAALLHESVHRHLPTGGWGKDWAGLPDRGFGEHQPGGWVYNLLPFLEQQALHDLGGSAGPEAENGQRLQTPLAVFYCVSRRKAATYPNRRRWHPHYHPLVAQVARSDYAINGGTEVLRFGSGPGSLAAERVFRWPSMRHATGVCYQRSRLRLAEITDGSSHTYLIAEKHIPQGRALSGTDRGDNESMYSGDDRDLMRFTGPEEDRTFRPRADWVATRHEGTLLGSAHPAGFNASMVDGSVRLVSYSISQPAHSRLGGRADGIPGDIP